MAGGEALERFGITAIKDAGGLAVTSASLALPWRVRAGRVPGTAVHFEGEVWEVAALLRTGGGERFELRPWPEGEAIRHAARLDAPTLERLVEERTAAMKRERRSTALRLALPFAGLLPARILDQWEREYGLPAKRAVIASAVLELAFAALVPIQVVSIVFQDPLLPGAWGWIAVLAAVAGADGLARLAYLRATNQPIGSLFTAPVGLFLPRTGETTGRAATPYLVELDAAAGRLELASAILRADWHEGGVLEFRGKPYRLAGLVSHGSPWLYRFEAVADGAAPELPRLRLSPPAPTVPAAAPRQRVSILGDALKTTAFAFAPEAPQREWALAQGYPALALTVGSAGLELIGGAFNLVREGHGAIAFALLDLFFIGEGALRLALAALHRAPCGSLFGVPFRPLYPRWLAAAQQMLTGNGPSPPNERE